MTQVTQSLTTVTTVEPISGKTETTESWLNTDLPVDVGTHNIPSTSKMSDFDQQPWYILYWIDQYNSLPEAIKNNVRESIEKPEYFKDFSESIASLLNVEFIKDNSVVPVSDIGTNISAYTYSRVLDFVLTQESVNLHEEMSIKTNNMFKINMTYIKDDDNVPRYLSTTAHGRNLITDSQHYVRMKNIIDELRNMIAEKLGPMSSVLEFIQSNISNVHYTKWVEKKLIESTCVGVDLFGERITTTPAADRDDQTSNNTTLNSQDIPVS